MLLWHRCSRCIQSFHNQVFWMGPFQEWYCWKTFVFDRNHRAFFKNIWVNNMILYCSYFVQSYILLLPISFRPYINFICRVLGTLIITLNSILFHILLDSLLSRMLWELKRVLRKLQGDYLDLSYKKNWEWENADRGGEDAQWGRNSAWMLVSCLVEFKYK